MSRSAPLRALAFGLAAAVASLAMPAEAQNRFDYPTVDGQPIDHCESLGTHCGRGGADTFCRAQGYDRADSWNTYNPGRSITLGARQQCDSGYCTAFRDVTCVNDAAHAPTPQRDPQARRRSYPYPSVSGLYIDHCETFGRNCGQGGATAFCRSQGFDGVESWQTFQAVRTLVLGSSRECNSGNCTGFSEVICANQFEQREPRRANRGERRRDERTFRRPREQGLPVDHCVTAARNCGQGGANAFCRSRGFGEALTFETHNPGATWIVGSQRRCNGPDCTALRNVRCTNVARDPYAPQQPSYSGDYRPNRPAQRSYDFPRVSGVAVDHCSHFGENCGRGGAELFCRQQGYATASAWTTYSARQTYVIGARRYCDTGNCTALASVTCSAGAAPAPYAQPYGNPYPQPNPRRERRQLRLQWPFVD